MQAFFDRWAARLPAPLTAGDRAAGYTHRLALQQVEVSYYASIPAMKQELLEPLVQRFGEYVLMQSGYVQAFGLK